jgi:hypothetical protein
MRVPGGRVRNLAERRIDEGRHKAGRRLRRQRLGRRDAFRGRGIGTVPFGGSAEVLERRDATELSLGVDRCSELVQVDVLRVGDTTRSTRSLTRLLRLPPGYWVSIVAQTLSAIWSTTG